VTLGRKVGNKLKAVGMGDRWVEIPHADMTIHNSLWMRTNHGGQPHFSYKFNPDGTMSPDSRPDIVMGLCDPSPCARFRDCFGNHLGWKNSLVE